MRNLYKQNDIFLCKHDTHQRFSSKMSVYHILEEKKCFPDGCIYFKWKCKILAKNKKCHRSFTMVGRHCFSCKYFYEEKIHQYPEMLLDGENRINFFNEHEEFEEWVAEIKRKRISCEGEVSSIRPDFILYKNDAGFSLNLKGFLFEFEEGYIDNQHFADRFYLSVSSQTQNKLLIREGDILEFEAFLSIDRGRFKMIKSGKFQFYTRGVVKPLRASDILVQSKTFSVQRGQPQKCMRCRHGILTDVHSKKPGPTRAVVCLLGVYDYRGCVIAEYVQNEFQNEQCVNTSENSPGCNFLLK